MFLTKLLLNKEITQHNGFLTKQGEYMQAMIREHLVDISTKFQVKKEEGLPEPSDDHKFVKVPGQPSMNKQLLDII